MNLKNNSECLAEPMWLVDSDWELTTNEDTAGVKGFFDLQSTSKIRLGCQLLRNFHNVKKELKNK